MSTADRRRASRIALEVPAAVIARSGPILAELRDVSITGVKVFLKADDLGLPGTPGLLEAAMAVKSALPDLFMVKLAHNQKGEIERSATMARLVLPSYDPDCVELGCMFTEPLTPDELTSLCGTSPKLGSSDRRAVPRVESAPRRETDISVPSASHDDEVDSAEEAEREETEGDAPARTKAGSKNSKKARKKTYRVFVASDGEETQLLCHTTAIDREGIQIRASDTAIGAEDAAEAALVFARRYGTEVSIKIMDGVKHLWSGPAQVLGMEIIFERPGDLLVTIAFGRNLRTAEIERLGVETRVA